VERPSQRLSRADEARWVAVSPPKVEPLTPEWAALKFLEPWTADDLRLAIEKDVRVDLAPFWPFVEDTVVQYLVGWFKTYRPDLASVLETEEGRAWLKRNLRTLTRL
jgi:hypothetical protein